MVQVIYENQMNPSSMNAYTALADTPKMGLEWWCHRYFLSFRQLQDSNEIPYPKGLNRLFLELREQSSALSKLFPTAV